MTKRARTKRPDSHKAAKISSAVALEGIVVADIHFKLIAIDRQAEAILNDLAGQASSVDGPVSLPAEILNLLSAHPLNDLDTMHVHLSAGTRDYSCRVSVTKPRRDNAAEPLLVLYLKREVSVIDTVHRVGQEYHLTEREQEALIGVSMGLTSKQLGVRMNVSPNTVKAFLRLIMLKMGATTRSGVVGKLLGQHGYLLQRGLDDVQKE